MKEHSLQNIQELVEEIVVSNSDQKVFGHYTSTEVVLKVLKGYDTKSNCIFLWATDARHSNDKHELQTGFDYLMNLVKLLDSEIFEKYRLSTFWKDLANSEKYKDLSAQSIVNYFFEGSRTPYIISLSKYIDDLNMWKQMYGHGGEGVCIELDFFDADIIHPGLCINQPTTVAYIGRLGYLSTLNMLQNRVMYEYIEYIKNVANKSDIDDILKMKIQTLDLICSEVSSYIKDGKWHSEQEVRIVCNTKEDNSELVKIDESLNRKYVEIPIPISCIKRIILGPRVNNNILKEIQTVSYTIGINPEKIIKSNEPLK